MIPRTADLRGHSDSLSEQFLIKNTHKMTKQQQSIIDALTTEFLRINQSKPTKCYNLINSNALQEETNREKKFAELSKQDLFAWDLSAYAEMERIIQLLREDLPDWVEIEKYDTYIGKYDAPSIQLRNKSVSPKAHHEEVVSIHVNINKEYKKDGNSSQQFGKNLYYTTSETGKKYDTIEDAVSDSQFQYRLRKKVIR